MRQAQTRNNPAAAAHAGLVLARYLGHPADGSPDARAARDAVHTAARAAADRARGAVYKAAFDRWADGFPAGAKPKPFRTAPRLVVRIGGHTVLEIGLTLHHTYGVPVIPGAALKGLAAHYCRRAWAAGDPKSGFAGGAEPGEFYKVLFGTTDEGGLVTFHDAWADPADVRLVADVMTPHHGDYIHGDAGRPVRLRRPGPGVVPGRRGEVPRRRLRPSAADGWTADAQNEWAGRAFDLLAEAIKEWGVGAKTAAGYGRLVPAG